MEASAGPNLVSLGHHHHNLSRPDDKLSIMIMEAGVIFHSISTNPLSLPIPSHPIPIT